MWWEPRITSQKTDVETKLQELVGNGHGQIWSKGSGPEADSDFCVNGRAGHYPTMCDLCNLLFGSGSVG